jgi:hypothetical protein
MRSLDAANDFQGYVQKVEYQQQVPQATLEQLPRGIRGVPAVIPDFGLTAFIQATHCSCL